MMNRLALTCLLGLGPGILPAADLSAPSEIAGLILHLDASTGVVTNQQGVSAWMDQSGSGFHFSQTVSNRQPAVITNGLNGHPVIRFTKGASNAEHDYLSNSNLQLNTTQTLFFVIHPNNLPTNADQRFAGHYPNGQLRFNAGEISIWTQNANADLGAPQPSTNGFQIVAYRFENNAQIALDEPYPTVTRNGLTINQTDFIIGGVPNTFVTPGEYGTFDGSIAEILIYNRALPDRDLNRLGFFLAQKYGLKTLFHSDSLRELRYTFNGLVGGPWPGTSIYGQDRWATTGGDTNLTVYTVNTDWSLGESAYRPDNGDGQATRPDSLNAPMDVLRLACTVRARNNANYQMTLALRSSANGETTGQVGFKNNTWYLREADFGTEHPVPAGLTPAGEGYDMVLELDTTANGGNGSGSLFIRDRTNGGLLSPVAGLQNLDLKLLDMDGGASSPLFWDALYLRLSGAGANLDDIRVLYRPQPNRTIILVK